jgi:tetratricopeptide (TPR) repeat protein
LRTTPKFFLHWHWRLHAELGATEAFLHAGDVANARRQADTFLQRALSTAEPNMQAHAWDVKSRAGSAEKDFDSATECIHNALAILAQFEIPLAGWQVHRTAWDLYAALGDREKADRHRARAQELILRIADSFESGEPLRESFLAAPPVRRIFAQHTLA